MKHLLRTYILLCVGVIGLLSCGANDPCTGIQCSGQNVTGSMCVAGACEGLCATNFGDCNHDLKSDGCEVNLQTDAHNCSHCGAACSANHITGPSCTAGVCAGTCDPGWSDCNKDKLTDGCETMSNDSVSNCGGCGKPCSSNHVTTPTCTAGLCSGACDSGYLDCNNDKLDDGCESNPATDLMNCGGCGKACSTNHVTAACTAGVCNGACDMGFADCNNDKQKDGCETMIGGDASNCGACGQACPNTNIDTPACTMSQCSGACNTGFADCDNNKQTNGCEVNLQTDANNCGACASKCSANNITTPACAASLCTGACNTGFADCDSNKLTNGCETPVSADINNCGGCNNKCSNNNIAAPACAASACSGACNAGFADCNNNKLTDGCEVSIATDPKNCGGCAKVCSNNNIGTPACAASLCSGACNAGFADCDNNKLTNGCEVSLATDANNCGGCAKVCSANNIAAPACAASLCTGACNMGFADCDNNKLTNGCETSLVIDANNCGGCNNKCSANNIAAPVCAAGLCAGACNAGFADCDNNKLTNGCEVSTNTDANNCGGCAKVCSNNNIATPACAASLCSGACNAGFADCDNNKLTNGCEVSTNTDANNCGGCAKVCSANNIAAPTCAAGLCSGTCNAGFADCNSNKLTDGCEVNTNTDKANCGGCGKACSANNIATPTCGAGLCTGTCNAGFADCNNNKLTDGCEVNTNTDKNNCGVCGKVCAANQACSNGVCTVVDPCVNYGGTQVIINTGIAICKGTLAWGTWDNTKIPAPWAVCDLTTWPKYAPAALGSSFGLNIFTWLNNNSCGAGMHHEYAYVFNMNDPNCYNGNNCCLSDSNQFQLALCLP